MLLPFIIILLLFRYFIYFFLHSFSSLICFW